MKPQNQKKGTKLKGTKPTLRPESDSSKINYQTCAQLFYDYHKNCHCSEYSLRCCVVVVVVLSGLFTISGWRSVIHWESLDALREGWRYQMGWIFGKGGVILNPKIYIADFGPLYRAFFRCFWKVLLYNFPEMGGRGGRRPFGIFPKIHPIW